MCSTCSGTLITVLLLTYRFVLSCFFFSFSFYLGALYFAIPQANQFFFFFEFTYFKWKLIILITPWLALLVFFFYLNLHLRVICRLIFLSDFFLYSVFLGTERFMCTRLIPRISNCFIYFVTRELPWVCISANNARQTKVLINWLIDWVTYCHLVSQKHIWLIYSYQGGSALIGVLPGYSTLPWQLAWYLVWTC